MLQSPVLIVGRTNSDVVSMLAMRVA